MTEISNLPVHEAMTLCKDTTIIETIIELTKHSDPKVRQRALKVKIFILFLSDSLIFFISNSCKLEQFLLGFFVCRLFCLLVFCVWFFCVYCFGLVLFWVFFWGGGGGVCQ